MTVCLSLSCKRVQIMCKKYTFRNSHHNLFFANARGSKRAELVSLGDLMAFIPRLLRRYQDGTYSIPWTCSNVLLLNYTNCLVDGTEVQTGRPHVTYLEAWRRWTLQYSLVVNVRTDWLSNVYALLYVHSEFSDCFSASMIIAHVECRTVM